MRRAIWVLQSPARLRVDGQQRGTQMKHLFYSAFFVVMAVVTIAGCGGGGGGGDDTPITPTITDVSPTSGSSGTEVTITGTNFSTTPTDNAVAFNGTAATVVSATSTQIVVTVPAGATSGALTVTVGGLTATYNVDFTVMPKPLMGGSVQGTPLSLATSAYAVTTLAGSGTSGTLDGTGTAAQFNDPIDVTTDGTYLYVADANANTIRRVRISDGLVETIAGQANTPGFLNDTGTAARFDMPVSITTDGTSLYICDYHNHAIRKLVLATGAVTTFLGSTNTVFGGLLQGVTTDGTYLYVSVWGANSSIYRISLADPNSRLAVWQSGALYPFVVRLTTDGSYLYATTYGPNKLVKIDLAAMWFPTTATDLATGLNSPNGVTTDGTYLYVSDTGAYLPEAYVTVFSLAGASQKTMTATGPAFGNLRGITTDGVALFVGDQTNHGIRKIH